MGDDSKSMRPETLSTPPQFSKFTTFQLGLVQGLPCFKGLLQIYEQDLISNWSTNCCKHAIPPSILSKFCIILQHIYKLYNYGRLKLPLKPSLSEPLRSNGADYVLLLFIYFYFFIHRSFSETTQPILTKFSGIVYSGVV